jgi:hypothetical protein
MSAAAASALEEFGGLRVDVDGPGVECARGGFNLDPTLALGEEVRFSGRGDRDSPSLFPLGEAHDGHAFLGIDANGWVYVVGDQIALLRKGVRSALDALLQGRLPAQGT